MSGRPVTPLLAVDCVMTDDKGRVVLIRRGHPPFEGAYALPGGFVDVGETVEDACRREMKEETNLDISNLMLVGVYSEPGRDPRGHTVSVAFRADADFSKLQAGDDATAAELVDDWRILDIAFDHKKILHDAFLVKGNE